MSVITTLYYVAIIFIVECGIVHFLCAMRVFEVQASPHPLGYLCAKFRFFHDLHCCASPQRKIAYSVTHPAYVMPPELKRLCFGITDYK